MIFTKCFKSPISRSTSNCKSRIFWFGPAAGGIQKISEANFLKEAKAAALQLRSPAGCGGEISMLKGLTTTLVVVNYCTNDLKRH